MVKRINASGALEGSAIVSPRLFFDHSETLGVGQSMAKLAYIEPPADIRLATVDIVACGLSVALRPGRGATAGIDWAINKTDHTGRDTYTHPGTHTNYRCLPHGNQDNAEFGSTQMVLTMQRNHAGAPGWHGRMEGFYNKAQQLGDGWGFGGTYYDFEGRWVTDSPNGIWIVVMNPTLASNFISIRAVGYR